MSFKIVVLALTLVFMTLPAAAENYTVFVDREFGFWAVRSDNTSHILTYNSRTLNINTGDTIRWTNMDSVGDRVTIVSDNMLWEGGKILGGYGSIFKFTFNSSKTYRFHMVETNRWISNKTQTYEYNVTDEETGDETTVVTTSGSPYYENYNYHYMKVIVSGATVGEGTHKVTPSKSTQSTTAGNKTVKSDYAQTTVGYTVKTGEVVQTPIKVTPTPVKTVEQTPVPIIPKMESYQEFTLYEVVKRWIDIIQA